jgi:hypothetical protein
MRSHFHFIDQAKVRSHFEFLNRSLDAKDKEERKKRRDRICNLSRTVWGRVKCDRVFNDLAVYLADA